jgi:type II secretory pathway component PulK
MSLSPPYRARNAALDRVEELLMIRGVTPEIFHGVPENARERQEARPGLRDLVTTMSSGQVNVNTASPEVLQAWFGLDEAQVQAVISRRDGTDGVAGTQDDQPFQTTDEFISFAGVGAATDAGATEQPRNQARSLAAVTSSYFTVSATGNCGGVKRTIFATMRRDAGEVISIAWREKRGGA